MDLDQLFKTILVISSFCLGWRIITSEEMILGFLREWALRQDEGLKFILKPIILCVPCFPSFWGVLIFIGLNGFAPTPLAYLFHAIISASFINAFLFGLYELIKSKI